MMHGLEVEEVITGQAFDHVVVGEIVGIKPHPNADKLRLADVITAPNGQPQEIVCGAPNIEVGQKVPVALIGAQLPNGLTIAKRAIRGVESNGMLCAADELGLEQDHSGIMVLEPTLKVGTPFAQVISANEDVIDVAVPANRADLMAMRGLAWEIGSMLGQTATLPMVNMAEGAEPTKKSVTLEIDDAKLCPLLTARVIRGVTQNPTPAWMINRLRAAGIRSINIVADITNYVMVEFGQPLHAYDAAKVHRQTLIARRAKAGEQLKTLDGKTRTLTADMLVIADAARAIGLAGVMGGEETEVTANTTDIILEAAIFHPVSIRKTSRHFGLMSEASKRFEKGLWPSLPERASAAAAAMMVELCGGTLEQGIVSVGDAKHVPLTVTLRPAYISERLGMKIPATKSKTILTKLGFRVAGTAKVWKVAVPEWRIDVTLPEDIVDEVGRMIGYEQLPAVLPSGGPNNKAMPPLIRFKEEVKNMLVDMGFTEVISHAFYGEDKARFIKGQHFEVANPLDATQHKLRKSLWPQIEDILKRQADAGKDATIFEIGYVFDPEQSGPVERQQSWKLALGVTYKGEGSLKVRATKLQQLLETAAQPQSFIVIKSLVRGRNIEFCEFDLKTLRTNAKVEFGAWNPDRHVAHHVQYQEQSKYPSVIRDIAFWWPNDEQAIRDVVKALNINMLHEFRVKDTYAKDGKTSYALTFIYQAPDRTLTKTEVDKLEQKIKDALTNLGATIR